MTFSFLNVYNLTKELFELMSTKRQAEIRAQKTGTEIDFTPNVAKKPASAHYVMNSVLIAEIIKCNNEDRLSEELVRMFYQIAEKLSMKIMYNDPEDRKDCIATAVMDCVLYWKNFNPETSTNGFAYITSICKNGFAKGWKRMEKMKFPDSACIPINSNNIYNL